MRELRIRCDMGPPSPRIPWSPMLATRARERNPSGRTRPRGCIRSDAAERTSCVLADRVPSVGERKARAHCDEPSDLATQRGCLGRQLLPDVGRDSARESRLCGVLRRVSTTRARPTAPGPSLAYLRVVQSIEGLPASNVGPLMAEKPRTIYDAVRMYPRAVGRLVTEIIRSCR